jgi:hypothetical protein
MGVRHGGEQTTSTDLEHEKLLVVLPSLLVKQPRPSMQLRNKHIHLEV